MYACINKICVGQRWMNESRNVFHSFKLKCCFTHQFATSHVCILSCIVSFSAVWFLLLSFPSFCAFTFHYSCFVICWWIVRNICFMLNEYTKTYTYKRNATLSTSEWICFYNYDHVFTFGSQKTLETFNTAQQYGDPGAWVKYPYFYFGNSLQLLRQIWL